MECEEWDVSGSVEANDGTNPFCPIVWEVTVAL